MLRPALPILTLSFLTIWMAGMGDAHGAAPAGKTVVFSGGKFKIEYNLVSGTADFIFSGSRRIKGVYSMAKTDRLITSKDYAKRTSSISAIRDGFGAGKRVTVLNQGSGLPAMKQVFYIYDRHDYFLAEVILESDRELSSNTMSPIAAEGPGVVDLGIGSNNRMTWMPYDNDMWYDRLCDKSVNGEGTSYEVSAMYDNTSRNGFVFGSVTHDFWKTGIAYKGSHNKLDKLSIFGGVTSERDTCDLCEHGAQTGRRITSPRIFVGWFADWRKGLETYADANTRVVPAKVWKGVKPVGWNSWGAFHTNMTFDDAMSASDYVKTKLQDHNYVGQNGVFYMNLDSWSGRVEERMPEFLAKLKANHQTLGMYMSPLAYWGDDMSRKVPNIQSDYTWGDLVLKTYDGHYYPKMEGGYHPLDPTHPGTRELIKYNFDRYKAWGVRHVKLDFMNGSSCEGRHYDPNVKSGVQAFNQGLKFIMDNATYPDGSHMFLDLELSPYFPYQFAQAQLMTSDIHHGGLFTSKYTLSCVTYGWWRSKLVPYNESGIFTFEETDNKPLSDPILAKTRFNAMVVAGSPLLVCIDPKRQDQTSLAEKYLTNRDLMSLARKNGPFLPVEGATGNDPSDVYIYYDGGSCYLAVFNFTDSAGVKTISLARAGLDPHAVYTVRDLWTGKERQASGELAVELAKHDSTILRLTRKAAR